MQIICFSRMLLDLTPQLVKYLHDEGYKLLFAKDQLQENDLIFIPLFVSIVEFYDYNAFSDAILTIDEALKLPFEVLLNHKVIL